MNFAFQKKETRCFVSLSDSCIPLRGNPIYYFVSYLQFQNAYKNKDSHRRADNPTLQKGLEAITSSINYIGGTIGTAVEVK